MFLVHVIAWLDLFVSVAQLQREIGIAFQVHRRRELIERGQREDFSSDLEHEHIFAERSAFSDVRLVQAIFTKLLNIHLLMCRKASRLRFSQDNLESRALSLSRVSLFTR